MEQLFFMKFTCLSLHVNQKSIIKEPGAESAGSLSKTGKSLSSPVSDCLNSTNEVASSCQSKPESEDLVEKLTWYGVTCGGSLLFALVVSVCLFMILVRSAQNVHDMALVGQRFLNLFFSCESS